MNKEVEGEEAGQRLNGSCEPRNKNKKKDYKQDPRGVIDKVFNHGTLSRHFRFLRRKEQPATASNSNYSQQPTTDSLLPTPASLHAAIFRLVRGVFVWRGEGGFVGDNSKPRLSLLFPFLQALSRVMRIVGGMVLTWLLSCVL